MTDFDRQINDKLAELSNKYPDATIILCGDFNEEADAAGTKFIDVSVNTYH